MQFRLSLCSEVHTKQSEVKMVFRKILQLLMAHPRFGPMMIEKLSESWPIRRAARFTAYLYLRGKQAVEENLGKTNQELRKKIPSSGKQDDT
jgi:hypothetical protein